jgi:hypothetical protein
MDRNVGYVVMVLILMLMVAFCGVPFILVFTTRNCGPQAMF